MERWCTCLDCVFSIDIVICFISLSQIATIVLHGIDWIMPLLVICLVLLRWNNLWEVYTRRLLIRLCIERHNDNAQNQQCAFFIQIKFVNQQMLPSKLVNYYNSATMIHCAHNCLTKMLIKFQPKCSSTHCKFCINKQTTFQWMLLTIDCFTWWNVQNTWQNQCVQKQQTCSEVNRDSLLMKMNHLTEYEWQVWICKWSNV